MWTSKILSVFSTTILQHGVAVTDGFLMNSETVFELLLLMFATIIGNGGSERTERISLKMADTCLGVPRVYYH
uniref:Putative secreted protein n=1 Tax=Anopheles marajoara TaxID=58244 RepID=A0A2M4CDP6_9DIPT